MLSAVIQKLKLSWQKDSAYTFLLFFCVLLPFQFALNPAEGYDIAIIRIIIPIFFLAWLILKIKNKEKFFTPNKPTLLLLAFLFTTIFSIMFSANIFWSLRKLLFFLTIFPIYFISAEIVSSEEKKRKVLLALIVGATALAWVALLQFSSQFVFGIDTTYSFLAKNITPLFLGKAFSNAVLTYPSWLVNAGGTTYMRAVAMFPDPHMLSYYFEALIPWAIALWALAKKPTLKYWLLLSVFSLFLADIFTFTRGSYIALIAGAFVVLPIVSKKTAGKILLSALILAFLFVVAPHNPVAGRLASSIDLREGSNIGRLSNWQQARLIITNHPFGVGLGSYSLAVNPTADYREPIYAHNLFLDITAELGVQTLLIFVSILVLSFSSFWKKSKENPLFIAGVSSITIFSVHSLVENPLYSVHVLPLFLIILTLTISHNEKTTNNQ